MISKHVWRNGKITEELNAPIIFYPVDKADFFNEFIANDPKLELFRKSAEEIMDRYGIRNKKILCVGPGIAQQEYWFSENGNQLLLIDIDENGVVEPKLKKIQKAYTSIEEKILYGVGDARRINDYISEPFDILLSFGFTLDEFHRSKIQEISCNSNHSGFGWPVNQATFSELILNICDLLPENGIFISLSYCGGPNATQISYVPAIQSTLQKHDMQLLDVHILENSPGVHLVASIKSPSNNIDFPNPKSKISIIHPRSAVTSNVKQIFSVSRSDEDIEIFNPAEQITKEIIENVNPSTKSCLYIGQNSDEITALTKMGINVIVQADNNSKTDFKSFPTRGSLAFRNDNELYNLKQIDLFWLRSYD